MDESTRLLDMTKRLQVLMEDDELRQIKRMANSERLTTAEWVRQRLREAADGRTRPDGAKKLAAIPRAYQYEPPVPSPDIEQMLDEIELGYLHDEHPG